MTVWDALVGQDEAQKALRGAATAGRALVENSDDASGASLSHAWLITGPPGSGRSVAARCLGAALQCTGEPVGCGTCPGCHTAMAGTNADVTIISTDKVIISIDQARELVVTAQSAPSQGRWKVIIVEDADRMTERTANVLLKAIEEPPSRTVWLLCAPSPADLLTTIRSRCRGLQLRTPSPEAVAELLMTKDGADPQAALEAALLSQSHIGVARALIADPRLRQKRRESFMAIIRLRAVPDAVLVAGRLVEAAKTESVQAVEERSTGEKAELMRALGVEEGSRIPPSLRAQFKQLEEDQKRRARRSLLDTLDRTLIDLLGFYRDVLLTQVGSDLRLINVDLSEDIQMVAAGSTQEDTLLRSRAVDECRERLQANVAPLLAVEAMAVALANPRFADDLTF